MSDNGDVIDLCDSPAPSPAATGRGTAAAAAAAYNSPASADPKSKRAKIEPGLRHRGGGAEGASAGGKKGAAKTAEEDDDDSDVEFVHNEENVENGGNALLNSPARSRTGGAAGGRAGLGLPKDDRLYGGGANDDDDDGTNGGNTGGGNTGGGNTAGGKKKGANPTAGAKNDAAAEDSDDDDELVIVGTKGVDALIDFPHSRENCLTHRFSKTAAAGGGTGVGGAESNRAHCANCYCYVCDVPAKDCTTWPTHCQATHGERRWREERERSKRLGVGAAAEAPAQPQPAAAAAAPARSNNAHANRPDLPQYSIQALLEKLTVVHPVEATPPPTCITTLRHYQKQSLGTHDMIYRISMTCFQYTIDILTSRHTLIILYHPCHVMSTAFMLDVERSNSHPSPLRASLADGTAIRGGWLCDQVGMGKSAVTLALVASNHMDLGRVPSAQTVQEQMDRFQKWKRAEKKWVETTPRGEWNRILHPETRPKPPAVKVTLKASVILTSVSLLGQWEDECAKHLDGSFKVMVCHGSRGKKKAFRFFESDAEKISEVDIILSTSTKQWDSTFTSAFQFHRVVHDEGHLLGKGNSALPRVAMAIEGSKRWSVTATPCTSSITELTNQFRFLNSSWNGRADNPLRSVDTKQGFYDALNRLMTMMVRHTKNQRIGGDEALALPPSTTTTTRIAMTDEERDECRDVAKTHLLQKYLTTGHSTSAISRALGLHKGWGSDSKIKALRRKLRDLRREDPGLRAVIFTQYTATHAAIVEKCKKDGFETFEFNGSSSATKRDRQIREFQATDDDNSSRPAVFVITLRAGSVGITLTAASHCFLMEPALDPATEVQAAGRIHRLGQTKHVHVTKFVHSNSPEENILGVHREIAAGRIKIVDNHVPAAAVRLLMA